MASTISVNVYEIDGRVQSTVGKRLFSTGSIYARPYDGTNTSLYGIIHDNVTKKTYAVVETVAALATLAG